MKFPNFLTLMLPGLCTLAVQAAQGPVRSAEMPGGHIMATSMNGLGDEGYLGTLSNVDLTKGNLTAVARGMEFVNGEFYYLQDMALRDGVVYIPNFGQDMITGDMSVTWKRFEATTGRRLDDLVFGIGDFAFCYALTYDNDADLFYGLAVDLATFAYGQLVEINPATWGTRLIGNVGGQQGDYMASLAYNPADRQLYGIKDNGVMYTVDAKTAATFEVKVFEDYEDYIIPEVQSAQPMVYSPTDHCFVTVVPNNDLMLHQLAYLNTADGTLDAYQGEPLPQGCFITGLVCTDEYAPDNAPAQPAITSVNFNGPALEGTFSWTAPATLFDGSPLTGTLTMTLDVDGTQVWATPAQPGASGTAPLTLAQGLHTLQLRAATADGTAGPASERTLYTGHDNPLPPTGVQLDGMILHWNTPEGAAHSGYLDMDAITYDIYMAGVKVNDRPVADNWYAIDIEGEPRRVSITVRAVANGAQSDHSKAISRVIGSPIELPASFTPTRSEANLFQVYDANADGNEFHYFEKDGKEYFGIGTEQYWQKPDDWFILPAIDFADPDARYSLTFDYSNYYTAPLHLDDLEIWLGDEPSPQYMTNLIYSHEALKTADDTTVAVDFGVPEGGRWFIAFHSKAPASGSYRGIRLRNIAVALDQAASALAPGEATGLTITPAPMGALQATVTFTAPLTAINGTALNTAEAIEYTLVCGDHSAHASAMPGQEVSMTVGVPENGDNKFYLTPSTASQGKGVAQLAKAWVGIDVPVAPANVCQSVSADNMSITLSWDAPTEGQHGGYVDPAGISYKIYLFNGVEYKVYDRTEECSYTFTATTAAQQAYQVAPVAMNDFGQSDAPVYAYDILGRPHDVPMLEEFGSSSFDYLPWKFNTEGQYSSSPWNSVSNMNGLGIGDPTLNMGAMSCMHLGQGAGVGELISPKATTALYDNIRVRVRYWQYAHAAKMELWGRTDTNPEYVLLASETPGTQQKWVDWDTVLPDAFTGCGWTQFRLRAYLDGSDDAYCVVDAFGVLPDVENDFMVQDLTGPTEPSVGDEPVYSVTVKNSGLEMNTASLLVELLADAQPVASQTVAIGRTDAGRTYSRSFTFPMLIEYLGAQALSVRATVTADSDQVPTNDCAEISLRLLDNVLPTVTDLEASRLPDGSGAALAWSEPDTQYGQQEGFEIMPAMKVGADKIGRWTNIDRDGLVPFGIDGLPWEGNLEPCGWMVFDAQAMGVMNDPRLRPHSGKQMILARSIAYELGDEMPQASDWLISPRVAGGTSVSFWFNTLSPDYAETVGIWVSKTTDDPAAFTMQQPFTKSGEEAWEKVTFRLPDNARYFAFEYRSIGMFGAMLDDIEFTPYELDRWQIASYRVYRTPDNEGVRTLAAQGVGALSWQDTGVEKSSGITYHVTAVVADGEGNLYEGAPSNAAHIDAASVENPGTANMRIAAGHGRVFVSGCHASEIALYSPDGKLLAVAPVRDGKAEAAAAPGLCIVKAGQTVAKVRVL